MVWTFAGGMPQLVTGDGEMQSECAYVETAAADKGFSNIVENNIVLSPRSDHSQEHSTAIIKQ